MRLLLYIQPGAKRTEIVGMHGDRVKVRVAAPPVEGAANKELLRALAEWAGLPRGQVRLVRGASSRQKEVELDGLDAAAWAASPLKRHLDAATGTAPKTR